jgi:hypothetical protein
MQAWEMHIWRDISPDQQGKIGEAAKTPQTVGKAD